jgi:DNA-binding HxlR family transcriptional regulator
MARSTPAPTATDEACRAFQPALEFLGRRWVGIVLLAGQRGARRFSQYRAMAPGISDRMLTQRLRELEQHGLIERTVVPTTPVRILYTPTQRGEGLLDAARPLIAWSLANPPE